MKAILLAICAIVLLFLLPSIPIIGDIWFEFGNVIPETLGLVHPVLPDEVIELNQLPAQKTVTLTRLNQTYVITGEVDSVTVTAQNAASDPIVVTQNAQDSSFELTEAGEYTIAVNGSSNEPVMIMPDRTRDIIVATISALIQLLILYAIYRAISARRLEIAELS